MRRPSARRAEAERTRGRRQRGTRPCRVEGLERRVLLSAAVANIAGGAAPGHPVAAPPIVVRTTTAPTGNRPAAISPHLSAPFRPVDVRSAYGVGQVAWDGTAGTGAGQTIAVIDAYNDPNIVSDVAAFDTQFNLQPFNATGGPTFQVLNQAGKATGLPANVSAATGAWDSEETLDVEWAHAIAPQANIVLFEANSDSSTDLYAAVAAAAAYPGVSVVSMSFGSSEFAGEGNSDSTFLTPKGHAPVTFLASTGDDNAPASYPAYSPNVLAVGGTSLSINSDGSWGGETAWGNVSSGSGGGGGASDYEPQPAWQNGNVKNLGDVTGGSTRRTAPDVSMLADPNTGVYIYSTWAEGANNGSYYIAGGTSLACPMWAGLVAIADQFRAAASLPPLDGPSQTLPRLYQLSATDFHDVTAGNNGFAAGAGYDLATGRGTPVTNLLVQDLAGVSEPATHLAFTAGPASASAGSRLSPAVTVAVEDAFGDVVTSYTGNVTLSLASNPTGGTLGGTTTVSAVGGVATFSDLWIDKAAAGYTLAAGDTGLADATSASFSVTPGAPAQLAFTRQPPAGTVGVALAPGPKVAVEDAFGNVATADASTVTLTLTGTTGTTGTTVGKLAGGGNTVSAAASSGVAAFNNVSVATAGNFTFTASDGRLSAATSGGFAVTKATPVVSVTEFGGFYNGSAYAASVPARDAATNALLATLGDGTLTVAYYAGTLTATEAAAATPLAGAPASAGSYTVVATYAGSSDYLSARSAPAAFTIAPRPLHVTAAAQDKTYDATTAATVTLSDDRVAGDALSIRYSSAAFSAKDAGATIPVALTGLTVSGADAANYTLASATAATTAGIARRPITGVITAGDKVYDGGRTATILGRALGGVLGSDAVALTGGAALFDTSDAGSGKTVTATGLALGGAKAADYVLTNPAETARAAVTPRPVTGTILAADKTYDGTADATIAGTSLAGVLPADAVTLGGGVATFDRTDAGAATVTAFSLVLIGPRAGDYELTNPTETAPATIVPRPVTGTIAAADKVYDGTAAATLANLTLSGVLAGDVARLTSGGAAFDSPAVGAAKPVTAAGLGLSGPQAGDYSLTNPTETATASITPLVISGRVFNDVNGDGRPQGTEPGLAGRTVYLLPIGSSRGQRVVKTDPRGGFAFNDLTPGGYTLRLQTPAGSRPTTAPAAGLSLAVRGGQSLTGLAFGQTTTAALAGHLLLASAASTTSATSTGLAGWTVLLAGAAKAQAPLFTAATDAAGAYTFPAVPAGTYRLSVAQPPGYAPAASSTRPLTIKLIAGKVATAQSLFERLLAAVRGRRGRKRR